MTERIHPKPHVFASFVAQLINEGVPRTEALARARGLVKDARICDCNAQRPISREFMLALREELAASRGEG